MSEDADAGFMIASMVQEIVCHLYHPFYVKQTIKLIKDMCLCVDIGRLREMVQQNEILIEWIDGRLQLAGVLTKAGASAARQVGVHVALGPRHPSIHVEFVLRI